MIVQQILSSKGGAGVLTLGPDVPVSDAARFLSEKKIGAVVVSASGETADGILSERDIVRELGRRGPSCLSETVREMMTPEPITCRKGDSADKVLGIMTDGRFRHLPVMDEEGRMVGLISIGDVVKARLAELAMEKDALEGMIKGH